MDELEQEPIQDTESRRRSQHRRRESLGDGLLLGEVDETMTDLIFGAAKLNLKIIDLPIRYRERTYGSTNISRWKHGVLLLRMVAFAARRIKFV